MSLVALLLLGLLAFSQTAAEALEAGDEERALILFERELAADPTNRDTLWSYGRLLFNRDRIDQAQDLFQRSIESGGEHYYPILMLASIAELKFDYEAALAGYERCLRLEPGEQGATSGIERVTSLLADVDRFSAADQRLSRYLWWVGLGSLALFLGLLWLLRGR